MFLIFFWGLPALPSQGRESNDALRCPRSSAARWQWVGWRRAGLSGAGVRQHPSWPPQCTQATRCYKSTLLFSGSQDIATAGEKHHLASGWYFCGGSVRDHNRDQSIGNRPLPETSNDVYCRNRRRPLPLSGISSGFGHSLAALRPLPSRRLRKYDSTPSARA